MYSGYEEVRGTNPRQTASFFSLLTFGYTIQLFRKGFRGNLQEAHIYEVPPSCSSKKCGDEISKDWQHCRTALGLLLKRYGTKYFLYTCIHMTWDLFNSTTHAYAMSRFISFFEKGQTHLSRSDAYCYGGIVIFLSIFRILWIHNYYMLECTLGIQIRSGLTSLIYRKALQLRPEQVKGSSLGNMVTVLTKDIRTIDTSMWPLSDLFIGFVKFVYLTYLIYMKVGNAALVATAIMTGVVIVQAVLSRVVLTLRLRVGKLSDKRLHFTREVLSVLKIIKMYTWEAFFLNRICQARKRETKANLRCWYLGSIIITLGMLFGKLQFPIFLIAYTSLGYSVNVELIYYLMSLFKEHTWVIGTILPTGFALSAEFYASVVRVGRILNIKEPDEGLEEKYSAEHILLEESRVELRKIFVSMDGNSILERVSFCIDKPGLYMITGPLGSGKSSILKVILKEYPVSRGKLHISGNISYASQDPWLFPATVRQNILFGENYDKYRYETVLQVCCLHQDFTILPNGDNTIVIDGGLNLSKGQQARVNLARAIYKQSDIYLLDDALACLDVKVQNEIFHNCIRNFLKEKIVVLVTQNAKHLKHAKTLIVMEHGQVKSISKPGYESFENDLDESTFNEMQSPTSKNEVREKEVNIYYEDKNIGGVAASNYYRYVKYGGGVFVFGLIVLIFVVAQFTESYSEKLFSKWVDHQQDTVNLTLIATNSTLHKEIMILRDNTFDIYIMMIVASTVIDLVKSYGFLECCRRASIKFHKLMCQSVINCVMNFLDSHFIGNILNRFSYDLDHIDEVFPFLFKDLMMSFFSIGGTLILIVTVDWIFLLISIISFATLFILRIFYIPTARALKRLTAITRSPFIGHLNATIEGLSTIKAFKQENLLQSEFDKHQDLAVSAFYMEMTTARAFGFILDFNCAIFITFLVLSFLFINPETSVGNMGLALTQVFSMSNNLQWIIRAWSSLEQCMTSVERVVEYTEIPREENRGELLSHWPKYGNIEYIDVSLTYNFEPQVLRHINFAITSGEKVGIVGRTGAGKSSIVSTLFRLYSYKGKIIIDGVDISEVSLEFLRKNISIIPQDPIIFAGTVRENLDPYGRSLDKDIWRAIKNVRLQSCIENLDKDVLNLTLSTGQKQLLCIARALLRNNKIVVMDEPTANSDAETDCLIHELIEDCFEHCTLIMIAHRLHSTLKYDKVMVMDNGEIAEFDNPQTLLMNKQSLFYQMINIVE